jgi:hypothetical protein
MTNFRSFALLALLAGCTPQVSSGEDKVSSTDDALTGCHGKASTTIPSDDSYYLTSFGGSGESGVMSCGEYTKSGSWYYMASRQRFGCGAHVMLQANGKCVVAEADDYGPDVCVENAAGKAIIDASPLVAEKLYNEKSAGWSDRLEVTATVVDDSTPLGPCAAAAQTPASTDDGGTDTSTGSSSDPGPSSGDPSSIQCDSYTLGSIVSGGTCVQSSTDSDWYQCTSYGWVALSSDGTGPLGECTASYPLSS